jgi:hypothetical protein
VCEVIGDRHLLTSGSGLSRVVRGFSCIPSRSTP